MAAILPFGLPIQLTGNHCALILDFDSQVLFGNEAPPLYIAQQHGVNSNTIPIVTKCSRMASEGCSNANIHEQIHKIEQLDHLTDHD